MKDVSARLPNGVQIVPTYDRSAWIWATLKEFFGTLISELIIVSLVTILFLRNVRAAAGPIAVLLLSVLFTVLPMAAFNQTINLFSLAGLCIAIGAIDDATIVIVENCTAELARRKHLTFAEKREVIIHSIAAVAQPLLFSLLIILASFVPVFFLEQREARLFDPLAFTKTFAMAFSTLLTLFLLPIVIAWIFASETAENRRVWMQRNLNRFRYVFVVTGLVLLAAALFLLRRVATDFRETLEQLAVISIPALAILFFRKRRGSPDHHGEGRGVAFYRSSLRLMIKHRYAFCGAGLVSV